MNCRDVISEFEDRDALSDVAARHLKDCADCRTVSSIQTRVWQSIEAFEPVAVPNDFNFRVKSKIADARPNRLPTAKFPILRYVLGSCVAVLLLAFVVFNGFYSYDDKTVAPVAETPVQRKNSLVEPPATAPIIAQNDSPEDVGKPAEKNIRAKNETAQNVRQSKKMPTANQLIAQNSVKQLPANSAPKDDNKGGSIDATARGASKVLTPRGIPAASQKADNPTDFTAQNPMSDEQILSLLGIESAAENGKHKVKKIAANSVAERSGVKIGDVIEAMDGESLTGEAKRAKTVEGKKLTILRGTSKIEIELHN